MIKQNIPISKVMNKDEFINYCYKLHETLKKEKTKIILEFNSRYTLYINVA